MGLNCVVLLGNLQHCLRCCCCLLGVRTWQVTDILMQPSRANAEE